MEDRYASLQLSRERAKALQRELAELVGRYGAAGAGDGHATSEYLVHLAMAARYPRA